MSHLLKASFMPWNPTLLNVGRVQGVWDPTKVAAELTNVIADHRGFLRTRGGARPIIDFASSGVRRIAGLATGRFSLDASTEFLVYSTDVAGSNLERYQEHFIVLAGSRTPLQIGGRTASFGTAPDYQVVGNLLVITVDGDAPVGYWYGVGATSYASLRGVPAGAISSLHKYRLLIGRIRANPTHLRWSVPGSPLDFEGDGSGYLDLSERSGEPVTGITPTFYGEVYGMTRTSIAALDLDGGSKRTLKTSLGGFQQTIQQVGDDLFYASVRGLHSLVTTDRYGDLEEHFLSRPVAEYWRRVDSRNWDRAWSAYWPEQDLYVICLPTRRGGQLTAQGQFDQTMLAYHPTGRQWTELTWPAFCVAYTQQMNGTGTPGLLVGGPSQDGYQHIAIFDTGDRVDYKQKIAGLGQPQIFSQNLAAPYETVISTIPIDCGDPEVKKSFRRLKLWFDAACADYLTVEFLIDDKWDEVTTVGLEQRTWRDNIDGYPTRVWMNPNNEAVFISDRTGDGASLDPPGFYLADIMANACYAQVDLEGHGSQIRIRFKCNSRKFHLYGFEVFYLPETTATRWGRREDRVPVEEIIIYSRPAEEVLELQGETDVSEI